MIAKNGATVDDLSGRVFGRWTVIKPEYVEGSNMLMWVCECQCGTKKHVRRSSLISGRSTSCGCFHKSIKTKHGKSHTAEYKADLWLIKKYGITLSEYDEILESQGGVCAICGSDDPQGKGARFHVDHCHETGEVRGLLCHFCNIGLGHFKDSREALQSAINYLNIAGKLKS